LVLIPPAVVAAVSLYLDLALTPFLYTCAFSAVVLMLLISPHSRLLWALAFAVIVLGIILLVGGFNVADWAAAALTWTMFGLRSGV
jgi:hypothetical protein